MPDQKLLRNPDPWKDKDIVRFPVRNTSKGDLTLEIVDVAVEEGLNIGPYRYPGFVTSFSSTPTAVGTEETTLREKVTKLEKDVSEMKQQIDEFDKRLPSAVPSVTLSPEKREQAKSAIIRLFQEGGVFTYSDILEKTDFSLAVVLDACNELEQEGRIASAE